MKLYGSFLVHIKVAINFTKNVFSSHTIPKWCWYLNFRTVCHGFCQLLSECFCLSVSWLPLSSSSYKKSALSPSCWNWDSLWLPDMKVVLSWLTQYHYNVTEMDVMWSAIWPDIVQTVACSTKWHKASFHYHHYHMVTITRSLHIFIWLDGSWKLIDLYLSF